MLDIARNCADHTGGQRDAMFADNPRGHNARSLYICKGEVGDLIPGLRKGIRLEAFVKTRTVVMWAGRSQGRCDRRGEGKYLFVAVGVAQQHLAGPTHSLTAFGVASMVSMSAWTKREARGSGRGREEKKRSERKKGRSSFGDADSWLTAQVTWTPASRAVTKCS